MGLLGEGVPLSTPAASYTKKVTPPTHTHTLFFSFSYLNGTITARTYNIMTIHSKDNIVDERNVTTEFL